jgi:hypothetical protein
MPFCISTRVLSCASVLRASVQHKRAPLLPALLFSCQPAHSSRRIDGGGGAAPAAVSTAAGLRSGFG